MDMCVTWLWWLNMMMSSKGNTFYITDPLWGYFTGHWWIPVPESPQCWNLIVVLLFAWANLWTNNCVARGLGCHESHMKAWLSHTQTALLAICKVYIAVVLKLSKINPLCAKFFSGNIYIYLHFMSFLHIDLPQILKILPQEKKDLHILYS